jgi:hypothetical protein
MRIYSFTKNKEVTTKWIIRVLAAFAQSSRLLEFVLKEADLLFCFQAIGSFVLFGTKMTIVVMPRTESAYDRIVFQWHEIVSEFCTPRDPVFTEEQREILDQLQDQTIGFIDPFVNLLTTAADAERNGVQKGSREMDEIIASTEVEVSRYQLESNLKTEELKKRLECCSSSGEFVDSFERRLKGSDVLRPIMIDLIDIKSMYKYIDTGYYCFAVKEDKKSGIRIARTKRPHKHRKPCPGS